MKLSFCGEKKQTHKHFSESENKTFNILKGEPYIADTCKYCPKRKSCDADKKKKFCVLII